MNDLKEKRVTEVDTARFDPDQATRLLADVMETLGIQANFEGFEDVAKKLSTLANKSPAWSAKYVHSVYHGYKSCQASPSFARAVWALAETVDDVPSGLAGSISVSVLALPGQIPNGSFIPHSARAVRCARPGCSVVFVKTHPTMKFHDSDCARLWKKERRLLESDR